IISSAQTFALTWFTLIFAVVIARILCKIVRTGAECLAEHRLPVSPATARQPFHRRDGRRPDCPLPAIHGWIMSRRLGVASDLPLLQIGGHPGKAASGQPKT
ncbi:MAG TPA: hypothetical protein VHT74_23900, partial [Acetobacteraceae bacterium]|nr:hypothetical protein [Acetobacteraceae bacterium]